MKIFVSKYFLFLIFLQEERWENKDTKLRKKMKHFNFVTYNRKCKIVKLYFLLDESSFKREHQKI